MSIGATTFRASLAKSKAGPYHNQSNSRYCILCRAQKSITARAFSVVRRVSRMILPGRIQLSSAICEASFRFRKMSLCSSSSPGRFAAMITRQGVTDGVTRSVALSFRAVTSVWGFVSERRNFPRGKSIWAASPRATHKSSDTRSVTGRSHSSSQSSNGRNS